jgi:hypothetical protein
MGDLNPQSGIVNGRISNFRDLVESEYFRYFEGDSDSTLDSTNLLTNPNLFFSKKSTCNEKCEI